MKLITIVTEIYNREKTILRTIASVNKQDLKSYEYLIINFDSNDKSYELITRYLRKIKNNNFKFINLPFEENEIKRWNIAINKANGDYISFLEGDDYFLKKNYLSNALKILKKYRPGIFVANSNINNQYKCGILPNSVAKKKFYNFEFCPPPSEAIFIKENNKKKYFYDEKNYKWAAELSLYEKILKDGKSVYFQNNRDISVFRGFSKKKWKYFHVEDKIYFLKKNKKKYSLKEWNFHNLTIGRTLASFFAQQTVYLNFEKKTFFYLIKNIYEFKNFRSIITYFYYILVHIKEKFF